MKISILGHSGCGKSTLAKNLSRIYEIPVLHLDTVQFKPNWVEIDTDEGIKIVQKFMENDHWIIEGNYEKFLQQNRLEQSDKIIYLNFNRFYSFIRAYKRYLKNRNKTRDDMASGCIERFDKEFAMWILKNGRTPERLKNFDNISKCYENKFVMLCNQKQIDDYLADIAVSVSKCG